MAKRTQKKERAVKPTRDADDSWALNTHLVRRFLDARPLYDKLASEVAYSLERALRTDGIEFSTVSFRAKTLESFLDKAERKGYSDPFAEITDLSGVRVVHLYASDFQRIENVIDKEFHVTEALDKIAEQGADRFGYGARHFIVQLGEHSSGARYDDLKSLFCEIQVRTALQDAWAIISHHLVYKREDDVPTQLRRRINSLAGLLETADDQFERLRDERAEYLKRVQESSTDERLFGEEEINADSIRVLLTIAFPRISLEPRSGHIETVLSRLDRKTYSTIRDLNAALRRTDAARKHYYKARKNFSASGVLNVALAIVDPSYRAKGAWSEEQIQLIREVERLVHEDDA